MWGGGAGEPVAPPPPPAPPPGPPPEWRPPGAIDHEEPRGVAGGCGRLRDRVGRQRVVERGQLHGPSVYMVDGRPRLPLRARARHRGSADVTLTAPRAFPEGRAALQD